MMKVGPTPTKKSVLEQLLNEGMVLVALDARATEVDVPQHLRNDAQLRLNLSYRFGLPMKIDDWGVGATLTFAGISYDCQLPWEAIFLMVSHVTGQPYLFPDDIPAELLTDSTNITELAVDATKTVTSKIAGKQRPKLTLVSAKTPEQTEAGDTPLATDTAPVEKPLKKTKSRSKAKAQDKTQDKDNPSPDDPPPSRPKRKRSHLRLVK